MQVTYSGPFRAVDVPSLSLTVQAGETVSVPDDIGADLITRDDWAPARITTDKKSEG
jgi:hypothetical protein